MNGALSHSSTFGEASLLIDKMAGITYEPPIRGEIICAINALKPIRTTQFGGFPAELLIAALEFSTL